MKPSLLYIVNLVNTLLPETKLFGFKRFLFRMCGAKIGKNVRICSSVRVLGCGNLIIGDDTWIGPQSLISSSSKISIGANVNIAPRVLLVTGTHEYSFDGNSVAGKGYNLDIEIGEGCWICANSVVLGGAIIGDMGLVAAGSVVKGNVGSFQMVGGVPAKIIKDFAIRK